MNLTEFVEYREQCPICDSKLHFIFHSKKWQSMRYEDDRLLVIFRMDSIKKHQQDYKVGYSFGMKDNSWYVEFFSKDQKRFEEESPEHLRNRFKELDKNLKYYRFYKYCTSCCRYNYSSNTFMLNQKTGHIDNLCLGNEYFGLSLPLEDGRYRICKLNNDYILNMSSISFSKEKSNVWARADSSTNEMSFIQIPSLIKFTTHDETIARINKLMVFS